MDGGREGMERKRGREVQVCVEGGREGWGESGRGSNAGTDYSLVLPIGPISAS